MTAGARPELARWRVGFFVEVEVDASDQSEAVVVAEAACRWPGDWRPQAEPTVHEGVIGRQTVTARVMRSRALMAKEVDVDALPDHPAPARAGAESKGLCP